MSVEQFKRRMAKHLDLDLEIVVNENRSTMLNLLERKRDRARLSMHKMFLDAPEQVISAIAHYVRGTRSNRSGQNLVLRGFIQKNLTQLDYSHTVDKQKLVHQGKVYDLSEIYDRLNKQYFGNKLKLQITWYGLWKKKNRCRVIFGQYFDALKLVKIHRRLDDPFFPDYFVDFVVYHEMLHSVVPGYVDERGLFRSHGEEFKEREREFEFYEEAMAWEKKNRNHFFLESNSILSKFRSKKVQHGRS